MEILSDWRMDYVDGVSASAGVIIRHSLPQELTNRLVFCYFDHTNLILSAGQEAWIRFWRMGKEVMKLPAALVPEVNVRIGIASNYMIWQEHKGPTVGMLYWNKDGGANEDYNIAPFPLVVEADQITIDQKQTITGLSCLLAVLSLPPR